ncbi:hypothetical protein KRX52_15305 [Pseudomonas sp. MAP12]|uniref:DUF2059 domain-containing protein n=1 Tax=Geopseudomonas aromaticivorans TaxID=2849492 RepID=A0ABS6N032_9GAMM|nr:hypothetical protein [Pseudomonas aromaticivorans]MBV2134145.1 hypothetical protein [Pseudomonas aromaticivorans]
MRVLIALALSLVSLFSHADEHDLLYELAGWPQQRENFSAAVVAAQQRYQGSLPPAVYQTLVANSNRRFAAQAMDQRALASLRSSLPDPLPAIRFFDSPLGRAVVQREVRASSPAELARNAKGLPRLDATPARRALVTRLGKALPAREAGAEVSLALAGVAADSLTQMLPGLPGLLGNGGSQELLGGQRERLQQQIGSELENTLLYVYRDLGDAQLGEYAAFAESAEGQVYYRAALQAIKAALQAGQ